jgi:outer membrane protein insertion porin family
MRFSLPLVAIFGATSSFCLASASHGQTLPPVESEATIAPLYYGVAQVPGSDSLAEAEGELPPTVDSTKFAARLGTYALPPALVGPFQSRGVTAGANESTGTALAGYVQLRNLGGAGQNLTLNVRGGENVTNAELSFIDPTIGRSQTGYAVNLFNQRSHQTVFVGGSRDVDLPNGETPWVHRLGGGVEVFRPVAPDLTVAAGVSYQRVSIRDDRFTDNVQAIDERNNSLTYSGTGQDDLLTVNLAASWDTRNDGDRSARGSRVRVGLDQSIPIGDANVAFTRLSANYLQYVPLPLFGFAKGDRTLVLNLQGGTMIGEVPPYEAFDIDSGLVRGFNDGVGTGRSFVAAAAEYRYPIANFRLFRRPIRLGGTLFVDYGSDLGSGDTILGEPAEVRGKPGEGLGYGAGLRAITPIGTARLEFAWTNEGENEVVFELGDRF